MSSRQPSTNLSRTVLCLPLVKYSFATVKLNMTSVPWSHVLSENIFVLVEHATTPSDPTLQLRVVQGTNTLEFIPLTRLVSAALRIQQAHEETSGHFNKVEQLPIFAMTKENAIAIRFSIPNNESRRTQFNFNDDANRRELLEMLQKMGMAVTGAKSKVPQVPNPLPASQLPHIVHTQQPSEYSSAPISPSPSLQALSTSVLRSQSDPVYHDQQNLDQIQHLRPYQGEQRDSRDGSVFSTSSVTLSEPLPSHQEEKIALASQDILPPRRQLPFGNKPSARSSASSTNLQPLPKPTFVGQQSLSQLPESTREAPTPRRAEIDCEKPRVSPTYQQHEGPSGRGMPHPPVFFERPVAYQFNPPETELNSSIPLRQQKSNVLVNNTSWPTQQEFYGGHSDPSYPSSQPSSSPTRAIITPRTSSPDGNGTSVTAERDNYLVDPVDRIFAHPLLSRAPNEGGNYSPTMYATQSREVRMDTLNSMICDLLEDESFNTLCEDLGETWRFRVLSAHPPPSLRPFH